MIQNNPIGKSNEKSVPIKRYIKQTTIDFFRSFKIGEEAIIKTSDIKAGVARQYVIKLRDSEGQEWECTEKGYVDEYYVKRLK